MPPWDFLIALFDPVDEQRPALPQPPEAPLWPREVGPVGRWPALKGETNRAF